MGVEARDGCWLSARLRELHRPSPIVEDPHIPVERLPFNINHETIVLAGNKRGSFRLNSKISK